MERNASAQVICADRIGDGLLIYFDDGRIGLSVTGFL
jgi:hypothetical protein